MRVLVLFFLAASLSECRGVGVLRGNTLNQSNEQNSMEKDGKKRDVSDIDGRKVNYLSIQSDFLFSKNELAIDEKSFLLYYTVTLWNMNCTFKAKMEVCSRRQSLR